MADIADAIKLVQATTMAGDVCRALGEDGEIPFAIIPQTHKVESLEKLAYSRYRYAPIRKQQRPVFRDSGSFCEYWVLFSDENSRCFADRDTDSFMAVLDYHYAADGAPRWCEHVATLALRKSEEWQLWRSKNGARMTQVEMAQFIEDNSIDIVDPKPTEMIDVARQLEAKIEVNFESGIRLSSGRQQLVFQEEIKASVGRGQMEVPEAFTLELPVYEGLAPARIVARFRYRIASGKLTMWYDLLRPARTERDAYAQVAGMIKTTCGQVFNGKP